MSYRRSHYRLTAHPPQRWADSASRVFLRQPPRVKEAEAYFHKALDVARQQGAKSWEIRASTSLARLWQQQGKKGEARHLLSEIYNWFTEGFNTPDLQEAKALLDDLA